MKILRYFDIRHSLITRVVFWAIVASLAVFQITFAIASYFAEHDMIRQADEKVNLGLDMATSSLDDELGGVEFAATNAVDYLKRYYPADEKGMVRFLESLLLSNSFIHGVVAAFDPNINGYPHGYAPYVVKRSNGIELSDLSVIQPDYSTKSWYAKSLQKGQGTWNKMLRESDDTYVISYSIPFYDGHGKCQGVLVFDVNTEELDDQVSMIKPYESSKFFVLDGDLDFLIAPDNQAALVGQALDDIVQKNDFHPNESILVDIKNRVRGYDVYRRGKEEMRMYYAPTQHAGLTIAVELSSTDITAHARSMRRIMLTLSLIGIFALVAAIIIVLRRQMWSIRSYTKAAQSIALGNFHTVIPKASDPNELDRLGKAMDHMQTSLLTYMTDLSTTQQEKGKMENELHIASGIQKAMLPKIYPPYPDRDDLDIYGCLIPAREVGGDLYDFFIRDEKLYFCIGDVSGKGVPASLVMAVTRSLIRIVSMRESSPRRIMTTINDSMADMNESLMFVTMFIGVLDLPTGKLRYCNGGHNAPLLITDGGGKAEMLPVKANLPVGIMEKMAYEGQEIQLQPGDGIFLYTDGITEAEDTDHRLFGDDAMIAIVENKPRNNVRILIDDVVDAVRAHSGEAEQSDDITLLAVRYMGQQGDVKYTNKLTLANNLSEVDSLQAFISEVGEALELDSATVNGLNLALEEVVVNIINYAYPKEAKGRIDIQTSATDNYLKLIITDTGQPFDPTAQKTPDVTLGVEERQIGGLGIFLVRNIMDSVNYEYSNNTNILTLRKYINKKQ